MALELKITNEQMNRRHDDRNKLTEWLFTIDELKDEFKTDKINTKNSIENMDKTLQEMKANFKTHNDDEKIFQKTILDKIDDLEKKFAGKWVEKMMIFFWTVAWGTIITAFMYLILKK